jgi:hypothetical protein
MRSHRTLNGPSGFLVLGIALAIVASACSSSGGSAPSGSSSGTSGSSGAPDGAATVNDGGSSGSSGGTGAVPASCNGDEGGVVPTSPVALQAWLATRAYKCWTHESTTHPSTGPHGGDVQTYLNAKLDASMKTGAEHPAGAVAVKELFGTAGKEVTGWAVLVKTQPASAAGQGYYWYETFGTTPGASSIEGQGKALCVDCHSGGKDFVLIPYPLR